ncbi:hypothetical protein D4R30_00360 [archaeon]|nr:MAG: hypothetical protein D4R30_00360 [archaeon]
MLRRGYTEIEERMLSEYVTEELAGLPTNVHLRLGLPTQLKGRPPGWELERPYYLMTLQEADLVYRRDDVVHLCEFAVWRPQTKLGQLLVYRILLPDTPGYLDTPMENIVPRIVVGREEPAVRAVAQASGVDVEVWRRPWLDRVIADRTGYKPAQGIRI